MSVVSVRHACRGLAALLLLSIGSPPVLTEPSLPVPDTSQIKPGTLLVAARKLRDPNFGESVVLIFEHGSEGSVGVIVNRKTQLPVSQVLPEIPELGKRDDSLYFGGPVHPNTIRILVQSDRRLPEGHSIFANVYYLDQIFALQQLAAQRDPPLDMRFYAGYAGWAPDQLTAEILRGDWHIAPGDAASVFAADVDAVWPALIKRFSGLWTAR